MKTSPWLYKQIFQNNNIILNSAKSFEQKQENCGDKKKKKFIFPSFLLFDIDFIPLTEQYIKQHQDLQARRKRDLKKWKKERSKRESRAAAAQAAAAQQQRQVAAAAQQQQAANQAAAEALSVQTQQDVAKQKQQQQQQHQHQTQNHSQQLESGTSGGHNHPLSSTQDYTNQQQQQSQQDTGQHAENVPNGATAAESISGGTNATTTSSSKNNTE